MRLPAINMRSVRSCWPRHQLVRGAGGAAVVGFNLARTGIGPGRVDQSGCSC